MGVIRAIQVAGGTRSTTGSAVNLNAGSLDLGAFGVGDTQTLTASTAAAISAFNVGDIVQFSVRVGTVTGRAFSEVILRDGANINIRINEIEVAFPQGTADAVSIQATSVTAGAVSGAIGADAGGFLTAVLSGTGANPGAASNAEKRQVTINYNTGTNITISPAQIGSFIPGAATIANGSTSTLTFIINS